MYSACIYKAEKSVCIFKLTQKILSWVNDLIRMHYHFLPGVFCLPLACSSQQAFFLIVNDTTADPCLWSLSKSKSMQQKTHAGLSSYIHVSVIFRSNAIWFHWRLEEFRRDQWGQKYSVENTRLSFLKALLSQEHFGKVGLVSSAVSVLFQLVKYQHNANQIVKIERLWDPSFGTDSSSFILSYVCWDRHFHSNRISIIVSWIPKPENISL